METLDDKSACDKCVGAQDIPKAEGRSPKEIRRLKSETQQGEEERNLTGQQTTPCHWP